MNYAIRIPRDTKRYVIKMIYEEALELGIFPRDIPLHPNYLSSGLADGVVGYSYLAFGGTTICGNGGIKNTDIVIDLRDVL